MKKRLKKLLKDSLTTATGVINQIQLALKPKPCTFTSCCIPFLLSMEAGHYIRKWFFLLSMKYTRVTPTNELLKKTKENAV